MYNNIHNDLMEYMYNIQEPNDEDDDYNKT